MSNEITTDEAAKIAGCTRQHISALCKAEKIRGARKLGRDWVIPRTEAERLRDEYDPKGVGKPRKLFSEKSS